MIYISTEDQTVYVDDDDFDILYDDDDTFDEHYYSGIIIANIRERKQRFVKTY